LIRGECISGQTDELIKQHGTSTVSNLYNKNKATTTGAKHRTLPKQGLLLLLLLRHVKVTRCSSLPCVAMCFDVTLLSD
jgi:hypothetical protein